MRKIGPCRFSELPERYRDRLISGKPNADAERFFPYQPPFFAVLEAVFFSLIYLVPVLIVVCTAPYHVYRNPTLIPRIFEDMTSGGVQFFGILAIFGVIAWGLFFMSRMGSKAVARAAVRIRIQGAAALGRRHYGLLLDAEGLVLRHGEHYAEYICAFLPKSAIKDCFVATIRVWFPKRSYDVEVVKIRYVDEQGQANELELREEFSLSAAEMCEEIRAWL